MAKTNTLPFTQNFKVANAWWANGTGTIYKALQVAGADYSGGSNDAILKALTVTNTTTATAATFLFGLLDPSAPTISINAITASSTAAATGVTTSTGAPPGVTDTTALGVYMLLTGSATLAPGSFISAIGSSSAFTLSKATTGASPTGVLATPWNILGAVTVPAASGGAAAGTTVNVDLLGSPYVSGMPVDQSAKSSIYIPTGFKIICVNLTAPAASNGFFSVHAQIEEF